MYISASPPLVATPIGTQKRMENGHEKEWKYKNGNGRLGVQFTSPYG
jgi:hypothetical protein